MSLRPLASLTVKMLGLYAFIHALPTVSGVFSSLVLPRTPGFSPLIWALLHVSGGALQMLVGIALWWFSDGIARSAVPEDGDAPIRRDEGLMGIGFSVVGAYLLADFVVKLVGYWGRLNGVSQLSAGVTNGAGLTSFYREFHLGADTLIPIFVQGVLGLYLLLGARGLVRMVANFKNAGRDREMESEGWEE